MTRTRCVHACSARARGHSTQGGCPSVRGHSRFERKWVHSFLSEQAGHVVPLLVINEILPVPDLSAAENAESADTRRTSVVAQRRK